MPNINDVFPSKYLKAHDLKGSTPTVTIDRVDFEQVRGRVKVETKAVVYFRGKAKGLLLNKTNARSITQIAQSAITEDWAGKAIALFVTTTTFGQEQHTVIRIQAPAAAPPRAPQPPAPSRRPTAVPRIFTDDLEIDLTDAGVRS